jgi:hypothetical protein
VARLVFSYHPEGATKKLQFCAYCLILLPIPILLSFVIQQQLQIGVALVYKAKALIDLVLNNNKGNIFIVKN